MQIIRVATIGSVDDGKSTLIGRLLYETGSLTMDTIAAIKQASLNCESQEMDFSFFSDGLISEREQHITIDVAYLYFQSKKFKYILADTPGHLEYPQNMITGASTADMVILLTDASRKLTEQSYRNIYIASLLRISTLIICVNKIDTVSFSQEIFEEIKNSLLHTIEKLSFRFQNIHIVPTSALAGDNIVSKSARIPWYEGESVWHYMESFSVARDVPATRLSLQCTSTYQSNIIYHAAFNVPVNILPTKWITQDDMSVEIDQYVAVD